MIVSYLNSLDPLAVAGLCGMVLPVSIVGVMYFTCRAYLFGEF